MKLELKHLQSYLDSNPKVLNGYGEISDLKTEFIRYPKLYLNKKEIENIALILRPLSDLSKVSFIEMHEWLCGMYSEKVINDVINRNQEIEILNYYCILELFKNHFDIFGLIEKGLAININTLDK